MSMTRQEVFRALSENRCVEYHGADVWGSLHEYRLLDRERENQWDPDRWRIKPEPVPPGDLTYERAVELCKQGVDLEMWLPESKTWKNSAANSSHDSLLLAKSAAYRRKPAPKMVPLEREDIDLHRDLFKHDTSGSIYCPSAVSATGVWMLNILYGFREMQHFTRSTDGGKTWHRCEKEEKL